MTYTKRLRQAFQRGIARQGSRLHTVLARPLQSCGMPHASMSLCRRTVTVAATVLALLPMAYNASPHATTLPANQYAFGYAGTVVWEHNRRHPIRLHCDNGAQSTTWSPKRLEIIHPTLPCGQQVWMVNPQSGVGTLATVAGNNTMFESGHHRVADMTPATAEALGLDPASPTTAMVAIQPLEEGADPLAVMSSPLPTQLPKLSVKAPRAVDLEAATKNGWAEANAEGTAGMAAVVFVTKNRAKMPQFRASTIVGVVHAPWQFSWTAMPNPQARFPRADGIRMHYNRWVGWKQTAKNILTDQHSGSLLGLQYAFGPNASHFYAPKLISEPKWARSGELEHIALPAKLEKQLGHRFYATRAGGSLQLASR